MNLNLNNPNMKWVLLIGGVLACAVCALLATGGNFLRGNPTSPVITSPSSPDTTSPDTGVPIGNDSTGNAVLTSIVMARSVGEGNVPVETTNRFSTADNVIYAVAQGNVPSGTAVFARWSREGTPVEDTNEIVADRDYQNTYIEFHISPDGKALTPGNYTVQFYVNGNPGPQANFTIA